jgi:hypothetical protein
MAYPEYLGAAVDLQGGTDARAKIVELLKGGEAWTLKELGDELGDFTYRQISFAVAALERSRAILVEAKKGGAKRIRIRGGFDTDNGLTRGVSSETTPFKD